MQLNLSFDPNDSELGRWLQHLEHRLYVARSLVPSGYEAYFREQARYMSAHTSTAIEGNTLPFEAAMLVLVEKTGQEPSELEKLNIDEAYELMDLFTADKTMRIDQGLIRTFNSIVLKGLDNHGGRHRGTYRLTSSAIVDADARSHIRYLPPAPEHVPPLMEDFENSLRRWLDTHDGPYTAALAHFGLISIHPFNDGNGRTARLVADMILQITGWAADGMLTISKVIHDQIGDYYDSLRKTQGTNFREEVDITPFLLFHTEALCHAAEELENKVVAFNKNRDRLIDTLHGVLNKRQVTAMMFMLDLGPISSSVYARLTETSQTSAIHDLTDLVKRDLALREGTGKRTRYKIHPGVFVPDDDEDAKEDAS